MKIPTHKLLSVMAAALVLLTSSASYAEADDCNWCDPCTTTCCDDECGSFFAGVDWLLWEANACGLSYGRKFDITKHEGDREICARAKNVKDDWESGVRVMAGWADPCDCYDALVRWTHFDSTASGKYCKDCDGTFFTPTWSVFPFLDEEEREFENQRVRAKWRLNLNMLDFELGSECMCCPCLSLRPHVAIRHLHLDQSYRIKTRIEFDDEGEDDSSDKPVFNEDVRMTNDFKGTGVHFGVDADWCFNCFGIYAKAGASLLWGRFSIKQESDAEFIDPGYGKEEIDFKNKDHFRASRPMSELGVGIRWCDFCKNDCVLITVKLGWEHNYFFEQNHFVLFGDDSFDFEPEDNSPRGGIGIQGLTLSFMAEF